ncbi:MAG: hypothetical protein HON33_03880 [Flavobacteriaceae bacterium]|nr:hypothetical protein [Flavobacteriaceae bacterium]
MKNNRAVKDLTNSTIDELNAIKIDKRINFLHRDLTQLTKLDLEGNFPEYLIKNKEKYLDYIV